MEPSGWKCRSFLGLALLLSLEFFFSARGGFFVSFTRQKPSSVENGMGGRGYPESALSQKADGVSAGTEGAGVPEPESFSRPRVLLNSVYIVQEGDMIGTLAEKFGLNDDTLISLNKIRNTRTIQIGLPLKVPNQDGILYTVKKGDTLEGVAETWKSDVTAIRTANELFSGSIHEGAELFIPGARMDVITRQEINGDLFLWPVSGYITSAYGYRKSPFTGARQFHSGLDIGSAMGAPVRAAMSGRVSYAGWDDAFGNYVVVSHHSGYRTLYGHMSVIRTKLGAYVGTGERIGDVGSTGLSTGPHLHFTVFKNGVTVNPRSLMK
ncbi:MAG: M23 family metallopeptidase [Treponema sp.]|jgi:murein DD-endopeptidase MepM/ murein hydrolase activator NlpD|nr:M23 family metallopeptidase [Treponema sp.]